MSDGDLDVVLAALSDPTRRALVAQLARGSATVNELAAPHDISIPTALGIWQPCNAPGWS